VNGVAIANVDGLEKVLATDPGYWEIQIDRGGHKLQMKLR
jgi:hypothetical protein